MLTGGSTNADQPRCALLTMVENGLPYMSALTCMSEPTTIPVFLFPYSINSTSVDTTPYVPGSLNQLSQGSRFDNLFPSGDTSDGKNVLTITSTTNSLSPGQQRTSTVMGPTTLTIAQMSSPSDGAAVGLKGGWTAVVVVVMVGRIML